MEINKIFECPECDLKLLTAYSKDIDDRFSVRKHKCWCCEKTWVVAYENGDVYKILGCYLPKQNTRSLKEFLKKLY